MKPYYEDSAAGIVIYCGDCREILPTLEIGCIVADPPYGISYSPGAGGKGWTNGVKSFSGDDLVHGDSEPFDPSQMLSFEQPTILWGANHYADKLPPRPSWLIWDKREGRVENDFADCEMAWCSEGFPARVFHHLWCGAFRASERGERRYHPTQKPVSLMRWCMRFVDGEPVVDPYMGSASTLVAEKLEGRRAVGIELSEEYCFIAANRLRQGVLNFDVVTP